MGASEQEALERLEIEDRKFQMEYAKDQKKRERIDSMLKVVDVLSKGYVNDKGLKDQATNLAARALIKELESF